MVGPREPVQTALPLAIGGSTTDAAAYLLGYVRTDAPGYREIDFNGLHVLSSGEYRFDDLIDLAAAIQTDLSWVPGQNRVFGIGQGEVYPDRLGWLIGAGVEAGGTPIGSDYAAFIPPAAIPLMGATWAKAETDADRRQILDRHKRNQGYVWGGASLWSCKMVMHRWALEALQIGWCLRGKVCLGCADMLDTPISASEPRGAITGYALGLDSVSWLDSIQHTARVEMTIVTA